MTTEPFRSAVALSRAWSVSSVEVNVRLDFSPVRVRKMVLFRVKETKKKR